MCTLLYRTFTEIILSILLSGKCFMSVNIWSDITNTLLHSRWATAAAASSALRSAAPDSESPGRAQRSLSGLHCKHRRRKMFLKTHLSTEGCLHCVCGLLLTGNPSWRSLHRPTVSFCPQRLRCPCSPSILHPLKNLGLLLAENWRVGELGSS